MVPALSLLSYPVRSAPLQISAVLEARAADPATARVMLVDARTHLSTARSLCRLLAATVADIAVIAVLTDAGLSVVCPQWAVDDFVVNTAGPAELDARLRLRRSRAEGPVAGPPLVLGGVVIDAATDTARLHGRTLPLTDDEFTLLHYLARSPGQVFTRPHLLHQLRGPDFHGGLRTIDVHIRCLRAKLGPEHERLIGTVRNVGYRFLRPRPPTGHPAHTPDPGVSVERSHAQTPSRRRGRSVCRRRVF